MSGNLILKQYVMDISGYGRFNYFAGSRGKALAKAFGDFGSLRDEATFKDFLRIVLRCREVKPGGRFGEPMTVGGQPAFYVSHDRQYIQFVRPDSDVVLNTHPFDVEPPEARRGTPYYEAPPQ